MNLGGWPYCGISGELRLTNKSSGAYGDLVIAFSGACSQSEENICGSISVGVQSQGSSLLLSRDQHAIALAHREDNGDTWHRTTQGIEGPDHQGLGQGCADGPGLMI